MSKVTKIILGIVGGIAAFIIITIISVFSVLNAQEKKDYYIMGGDQIPSVKKVIGLRDLSSVSSSIQNGQSMKEYKYISDTNNRDIEQYSSYLMENEGFSFLMNQDNYYFYDKLSIQDGESILLRIVNTGYGYTITLYMGEGIMEKE